MVHIEVNGNFKSTIFITEDGQIDNLVLGCTFYSEQVNSSKTNRIYFNVLMNAHFLSFLQPIKF